MVHDDGLEPPKSSRPPGCKPDALPAELIVHIKATFYSRFINMRKIV